MRSARAAIARSLFCLVLCSLVDSVVVRADGPSPRDQESQAPSPSHLEGWVVQYRFVGDPREEVYQESREVGPEGEEVPYSEKVILVRVLRVLEGRPPRDESGLFRYRSLTATTEIWPFPLWLGWPWEDVKYEFVGLRRVDPQTGESQVHVSAKPLWWSSFWPWVLAGGLSLVIGVGVIRYGFKVVRGKFSRA